jgi:hypothetical protein
MNHLRLVPRALAHCCAAVAFAAAPAGAALPEAMLAPAGSAFLDIASVPYTDSNSPEGGTDTVNFVPDFCAARMHVDGPERIYRFVPQEGASVTFTATPQDATYDIAIYLIDSLKGGKYCLLGADDHGPGEAESFSFSDRFIAGRTYYLYVDSFFSVATDPASAQGPYVLELAGSLPVDVLRFGID